MSNPLQHNKGGDTYIVPRGATGIGRARFRPAPPPADKARGLREMKAQIHHRYRLRNAAGEFLHMSVAPDGVALLFTTVPADAWISFEATLVKLRAKFPETRTLTAVLVPRDAGSDVLHSRRILK